MAPLSIGSLMLYKYIGSEDSQKVLRNLKRFVEDGTISASAPSSFNDPSEFKVSITMGGTEVERRKHFEDNGCKDFSFEDWDAVAPEAAKSLAVDLRKESLGAFGVVCLSPNEDNILMWSHYSVSHKGFCIGFDDDFVTSIEEYHSFDNVKYIPSVPVFDEVTDEFKVLFDKLFFYKHECWKYEEEQRVITKKIGAQAFDKKYIREIILGHNVSPEVEEYARTQLDTSIEVYKMSTPDDGYLLVKEKLK